MTAKRSRGATKGAGDGSITPDELVTLQQEVKRLDMPQQSERFVKSLRAAASAGEIEAVYNGQTFTLPKVFTDTTRSEQKTRNAKDMIIRKTPAYEEWFKKTQDELSGIRPVGSARVPVTVENFLNGRLDWKEHVVATRASIRAKQARGSRLGITRRQKKKD